MEQKFPWRIAQKCRQMNITSMVVTSYPISWERCLVLQMTAIKDCDFSVQASLMCWQSLKVINFQHPYSPVTHSIPQCYTSLIPLHNPPPQHLHTPHSIPHFTTLTANRGSPNFHSTTCGSHLTCGLLGSPGKQLIYVTLLIDIIYSYTCTFNYNTGKCLYNNLL